MRNIARTLLGLYFLALSPALFSQNFNFQLRSKLNFPGQTLANVFGYTQDGREYALVGGSQGLIIVDVTEPDAPVQIIQVPGPDNLWKEIKTYQNFCYVTTEGGGGLQVIDLTNLPADNLTWYNYTGDGDIIGALNTIHALHVDTTLGYLYLYGSNLFNGGAVVLDIHTDPYNPKYVGKFSELGYLHDGYANNDTLFGGHIFAGVLSIVDMKDKANPVLLGTVQTPGKFTHNSWRLVDEHTILTTDEALPSFVTAYDISDPTDIRELDRISTNDGMGSIGHNTHIRDNWAVTSWYTDGLTIADVTKPDNLVFTGWYDTWNGTGPTFDGCWGAYPLFPSGTVLATNISPGDLFILTPTYVRAAYLEGAVIDGCSGLPLSDVQIDVNSSDRWVDTQTDLQGVFKTGQAQEGNFVVTVSKPGYITHTVPVELRAAQTATFTVVLELASAFNLSGVVIDAETKQPIANTQVLIGNTGSSFSLQTDAQGRFDEDCVPGDTYTVVAAAWGYLPESIQVNSDAPNTVELQRGYYDDFRLNLGWSTAATASAGLWARGEPAGTVFQNNPANPDEDIPVDAGDRCYVTGNGGGNAGADDVDNGTVTLSSPPMALARYGDAVLSFWYWFFNDGGNGTPDDSLLVLVTNGTDTAVVLSQSVSEAAWRYSGEFQFFNFDLTDDVRVHFITGDDQATGHLVEAGVDGFQVVPGAILVSAPETPAAASLRVWPNPSTGAFQVAHPENLRDAHLAAFNAQGVMVWNQTGAGETQTITLGHDWPAGVYWLRLQADDRLLEVVRLVKQ